MKRPLALAAALVLPLAAGAAERDPLEGRVAGKPQRCLNTSVTLQNPQIVDERTILYRDGRRIWRTGPTGTCPSLRPNTTLIVRTWGGQMCANDTFQTLVPGTSIPSGPCRFTEFTPYEKPR